MTFFKKHKKKLQFGFFFALTVVLLWFSFKDIQWMALWQGICSAHYGWLAASVGFGIAAYFVRAHRWKLLIQPLGYSPSLKNIYNAVIVGYLANLAFPRLGEVARCASLTKSNGVPFEKLVGTVVVERVFDFICMITIAVVAFIVKMDTFGRFIQENFVQKLSQISISTWLFIVLGLLIVLALAIFALRQKNNVVIAKVRKFLSGIKEGLTTFVYMQRKGEFLLYTLLLWTCYWLMSWWVFYAIDGLAHLGAMDGLLIMLLGSFGVVAPTNGGLGAFHAIIKLGMPFLFGASVADSLLYATLAHESQMLFVIILGFIAYWQVFVKKTIKTNANSLK
ncbi:hypothetical protein AGMMS4956_01770 [Bacteroidia bacterium]|nr:hypothetical protein AGMMS4956_01770 [Bacteroidia bacterium]